jgi:hypothetical protein
VPLTAVALLALLATPGLLVGALRGRGGALRLRPLATTGIGTDYPRFGLAGPLNATPATLRSMGRALGQGRPMTPGGAS